MPRQSNVNKSKYDSSDSGSDAGDGNEVEGMWEQDEIGSINASEIDEDMREREEELRAELNIANNRCNELKMTLQQTKSFIGLLGNNNNNVNVKPVQGNGKVPPISTINSNDEDDEEDYDTFEYDSDDNNINSNSRMSENTTDLNVTPRKQQYPSSAVKPCPYYNLQDAPSPSGKLADRIDKLRQRCIEALGKGAFQDAYSYLKEREDVRLLNSFL